MPITLICEVCKKPFKIKPSHAKLRRTCSNSCKSIWLSENYKGKNASNWRGGLQKYPSGYMYRYFPEHPKSNKKVIPEHVFVMEKSINRYLKDNEVVHHINGLKNDNRIENLKLMDKTEHRRHHKLNNKYRLGHKASAETKAKMSKIRLGKRLKKLIKLKCHICNKIMYVTQSNKNRKYCSNKCKYLRGKNIIITDRQASDKDN